MLLMHVTYLYHCEGPHTLYYNHRHALLFLSLSLSIIKNAPQNQHPDTAYDFSNIKKRNICESLIHLIYQEASDKISSKSDLKQRSYSNFSNGVKTAKISEICASRTPSFRRFSTFYSDSESSRWEELNSVDPIEIGWLFIEIWRGQLAPPPVNVLRKAHQ